MKSLGLMALGAALTAAAPAAAQYTDAQMREMLLAKGNKFEIDKDKDYKIVIEWGKEKRSQIVWVSSRTENLNGMVIHEVFSPAALLKKNPVSGAMALALLRDASTNKLGGWQISGDMLYYTIMLPEPFDAAALNAAIDVAAETADNQELKMSGKKDEL